MLLSAKQSKKFYFHCKGKKNYLKDDLKAYPRQSFIIASFKLLWKQEVSPNEYCTERNLQFQARILAMEYIDNRKDK
jgi:hypothetical protein